MGEESEYLDSHSDDGAAEDVLDARVDTMTRRYSDARRAHTGATIRCPTCNVLHVKTTYHKVFCSNGKARGKGNCKDGYWNVVEPERLARSIRWGR